MVYLAVIPSPSIHFRALLQIEELARGWQVQLSKALEVQQQKIPQGHGPLAEIDYWRERNASLSALYEQLKVRINVFPESLLHYAFQSLIKL